MSTRPPGELEAPTVLGEFGGADQGGDGEAVPGADRQASPAAGHAAGAAAQRHALVRVPVVVPGGGQRQVAAHVLHAPAVALGRSTRLKSHFQTSQHQATARRPRQHRRCCTGVETACNYVCTVFVLFYSSVSLLLKKRKAFGDHHP